VVALRPYYNEVERLLNRWTRARFLPCSRHQAEFRSRLALDVSGAGPLEPEQTRGMDGHGWQPHFAEVTPEQRQFFTAYARRQYADALTDFRLATRPARALTDLLALCRRERIPAALVLMPEASTFRSLYPPAMEACVATLLAGLQRDWNVPVIDARTWVEDDGFWDAHHVLPVGAAAFTERFEREAFRPLLRSPPARLDAVAASAAGR
jgi:hypothetical protein